MAHRISDHRRHRLSVSDVRTLLRLYHHVHNAGPEPLARKRRLLEGVREITGADHASTAVARVHAHGPAARGRRGTSTGAAHAGFTTSVLSVVHTGGHGGRDMVAGHDGCAWAAYRPFATARFRRPRGGGGGGGGNAPAHDFCTAAPAAGTARGESHVHSFLPLAEGKLVACLTVGRGPGSPHFSPRERSMLCALHAESEWVYSLDVLHLAPDTRDLSPRQVETLQHLLTGKGEKQIAAEMRVRYNTLHHYVKALYRHFGVSSRIELLARWVSRGQGSRMPTPTRLG